MRVALLYPPPWKINGGSHVADGAPAPSPELAYAADGPPAEYADGDLDGDFFQMPYGLLSLGAQAIRAGHATKVLNLSGHTWSSVDRTVRALDADVFGLSCWTANRRGVALVARAIKQHHPNAHVVVGGPHATPLAREMLAHHADIDTISVGESERTFLELLERVAAGAPTAGIAGTVFRTPSGVERGPERDAIEDLDELASPHDFFDTHIVMTSRGCPWRCTFCGAEASWGRGFRGQSVPYVLDALERAVSRLPVKMIQIKDDTFTTNKKRVIQLCRGIRERKLQFLWSCDTRVDVLSDELLHEMRLAGCERLSLGVESGSQRILDAIDKKITTDEIIASTALAKKWGIKVRYYMMVGNRGETLETHAESLRFLERAKPHQYIFSALSVYPGTRDFDMAVEAGWLDAELYFQRDFQELKTTFDASEADTDFFREWFLRNKGLKEGWREGVDECRAIVERIPEHHAAHMDLAGAYYEAGRLDECVAHVRRAMELGYPLQGIAHNVLACVAARRGDIDAMKRELEVALRSDPQHRALQANGHAVQRWLAAEGRTKNLPLALDARHDFQLLERPAQPTLPGALPEDFATWTSPPPLPARPIGGSRARDPKKLRVVTA
jgi:radical SAM superfamily enzyme YgiQ (UPF0313 family)